MKKFSVRRLLSRQGIAPERGTLTDMTEKTGMHFNTASKYFNGIDLHAVHLDVLTKICDYLQQEMKIDVPLPGSLFYDDTLWNALTDLDVTFFMGANWYDGESLEHEGRISRHDHRAQSLLAAHLASLKPPPTEAGERSVRIEDNEEFVAYSHYLESDETPPSKEDVDAARALYETHFGGHRKLNGNFIIASQKANLLTELFVADCFNEIAFTMPEEPSIPFFLVPRPDDSDFRSCFGGNKPPRVIERAHAPGIHYRVGESWGHSIEWYDGTQDAGVVLLRHKPANDVLDVALFGFSGLGTYAIAKHVVEHGENYWGFQKGAGEVQIGLFLCEIALADLSVRKVTPIDCNGHSEDEETPEESSA